MLEDMFQRKVEERQGCAVILAGSDSDLPHVEKISASLQKYGIPHTARVISAHKQPELLLDVIDEYDRMQGELTYIAVAGLTDALSGTASFHSIRPVITCPPDSSNLSCLGNPPGSSNATVLRAANVGRFVAQMYSTINPRYERALQEEVEGKIDALERADTVWSELFACHGLEQIAAMEYPGRMILIGRDEPGLHNVIVYAVTGRSPSSQARKIVFDQLNNASVTPTDKEVLKQGNPDLLVYRCITYGLNNDDLVAVSNGKQTDDVAALTTDADLREGMAHAIAKWTYEPDAPNNTSRIEGAVRGDEAVLATIFCGKAEMARRLVFPVELKPGIGHMIATYTGVNVNPLPAYTDPPTQVNLFAHTAQEAAESVYAALAPEDPSKDFRVAAAAVFIPVPGHKGEAKFQYHAINRHEVI